MSLSPSLPLSLSLCLSLYLYIYICRCIFIYVYRESCMYICIYSYMYILNIYVYIHICIFWIYIYIYATDTYDGYVLAAHVVANLLIAMLYTHTVLRTKYIRYCILACCPCKAWLLLAIWGAAQEGTIAIQP